MEKAIFRNLLDKVLTEKGIVSKCYSKFHNYSLANQLLAFEQLSERGMDLSPIAPYKKWNELGRQVKKGSKALALYVPRIHKREDANGEEKQYVTFKLLNKFFSADQTEGDGSIPEDKSLEGKWSAKKALEALDIEQVKYTKANGNIQGYAKNREVAINPVAENPLKTLFHEIAHVVLGHTKEITMTDSDVTPRNIMEVEAESVAFILCELLGANGSEESKGYVQGWLQNDTVSEQSAQKIFSCADKILKAGLND